MKLAACVVGLVSLLAGPCDVADEGAGGAAPVEEAAKPVRDFVSVAVGGAGAVCGLWDDGLVGCWGSGPSAVAPEGEFVAISAGLQEMCGVRAGGEVHCWGGNAIEGALERWPDDEMRTLEEEIRGPRMDPPERLLAGSVPSGAFVAVGVGDGTACGIGADEAVACWGPIGEKWRPPGGRFRSVAVGVGSVACGVRVDGTVACWGDVSEVWAAPAGRFVSVEVAAGYACGLRASGEVACWGPDPVVGTGWVDEAGTWSPPEGVFAGVALNDDFACGVRDGGDVQCWGPRGRHECADGRGGCLGWGGTPIPAGPFVSVGVAKVRSGWYTSHPAVCGVRADGRVECWNTEPPVPPAPAGTFVDVTGSGSCAVRANGAVVCWLGGVEHVMADGVYTEVSGALGFGCGLRADGEIVCWGNNTWGAASPPPGPFTAIDLSSAYLGCGLRPDGEAVCWGRTDGGQGDPPPGPFTAIKVSGQTWRGAYVCGLRADATAECWGPQSALQWITPRDEIILPDFATDPRWRGSFPGGAFSRIDADRWLFGGWAMACGIRPDGELVCWSPEWPPNAWTSAQHPLSEPEAGSPDGPEDPNDDDMTANFPGCERRIGYDDACPGVLEELHWVQGDVTGGPYVALHSGWHETCGLRRDGTVDCWGNTPGSPDGQFTAVAVGGSGRGIRPEGEIEWWEMGGWNIYDAKLSISLVAPAGRRFIALGSGFYRFCGLLDDGSLICEDGSLDPEQRRGPFTRFSVGGGDFYPRGSDWDFTFEENGHVCAIRSDGGLECWGTNDWGQTTLATWLDDPPYSDVAAGYAHSCAIGAGGEVVCWGDDRHDQTQSPSGVFTALSAGFWHTCGLRTDGEIDCWGNGDAGFDQSYNAPPPDRPAEPPPGPFSAVAAGFWHTCALRPDGSVTCWLSY